MGLRGPHRAVALVGSADLAMALHETDRSIHDYLAHEVLDRMARRCAGFSCGAASTRSCSGRGAGRLGARASSRRSTAIDDTGLVERLGDGSLVCHPLLRAAARAELEPSSVGSAATAHREVAQWYADHGAPRTAVELCLAVRDWSGGAVLVESHCVPRLVAGTADDPVAGAACRPSCRPPSLCCGPPWPCGVGTPWPPRWRSLPDVRTH